MAQGEQSVDYKKIAHVFGGLLLILCGALWSLWNTGRTEDANDNQRVHAKQWESIRENRDKIQGLEYTRTSDKEHIEDLEARVRNLEWPEHKQHH